MARVLIAGATGYLGGFLLAEAKERGHEVRALTRSEHQLSGASASIDEVFVGEVTKPATLVGIAKDVDVVISAIGITRQKDGLTYEDVDYQGNANLLREAVKSGVRKFVYVSVLHPEKMASLKVVQAKERFVRELQMSGIDHTVIRPNGYFSDMLAYLKMAKSGRAFVFGRGEFLINPISGRDVAAKCVDAIDLDDPEISFGGPATITHREIAQQAFDALGTKSKVTCIPVPFAKALLWLVRKLTPTTVYGPLEFSLTVITTDMVGPAYGKDSLGDFFHDEVARKHI
ncbi:SDR family oxidoreductase [Dyella flagellata]|nr:SDR family oxidoreductase [Dyella flagellata]